MCNWKKSDIPRVRHINNACQTTVSSENYLNEMEVVLHVDTHMCEAGTGTRFHETSMSFKVDDTDGALLTVNNKVRPVKLVTMPVSEERSR
jgi:hypothetical protein